MKINCFIGVILTIASLNSYAGPNDSVLTPREQTQQDIPKNRQEINNATITPNSSSAPTRVNTDSWGLQSTGVFEITNHLVGYSTIVDKDYTFDGVKITGFFNVAYYSPRKENDGTRKRGRFVFGLEDQLLNISNRTAWFLGGGMTFGDHTALYVDTGLDFILLPWFKTQLGVNDNTGAGGVSPQVSLGFTW